MIHRVAAANQSGADEYIQKLVESYLEHDEWFRARVREGIAAAGPGELLNQDRLLEELNSWFPA